MTVNEAQFSVTGYVATQPKGGYTKGGVRTVSMRVGWTPRRMDRETGQWSDEPSSFISVQCFRKLAENAAICLRRGDPIALKGTLRVREYPDQNGAKRTTVEVVAESLGHDMSRGVTHFSKTTTATEMTAAEYEQAQAQLAAARDPLPGDRPERQPEPGLAGTPGPVPATPDRADREFEPGEDGSFDEDEATRMLSETAVLADGAAAPL